MTSLGDNELICLNNGFKKTNKITLVAGKVWVHLSLHFYTEGYILFAGGLILSIQSSQFVTQKWRVCDVYILF